MAFDYINEAFKKLDLLEEKMFDTSLKGINELSDFLDNDDTEEIIRVIDPEAETVENVQDSYVGKVIINCNICHSHIFEEKDNIKIEDDGSVNVEEQCPYCGESEGFIIVGEIAPFAETKVEVDGEEISVDDDVDADDVDDADVDNDINEGLFSKKSKPTHALLVKYDEPENGFEWYSFGVSSDIASLKRKESELHKEWSRHGSDTSTKIVDINTAKKLAGKIDMNDSIEESLSNHVFSRATRRMSEDFKEVSVTTGDQHMEMSSDENGRVSIISEPITESSGIPTEDVIAPISDETQQEILDNNEVTEEPIDDMSMDIEATDDSTEEQPVEGEASEAEDSIDDTEEIVEESLNESIDVDFDEVDEDCIDSVCEKYLKKVYENVSSFRTTGVSTNDTKMVVEGIITFTSGSKKNTGFIFESCDIKGNDHIRFRGYNKHLSESADAFTLVGVVDNKKLFVESLKYNYTVNNNAVRGVARSRK